MFNLTILEKDLNLEQDYKNYTYFEYYLSRDFDPLFFYFYFLLYYSPFKKRIFVLIVYYLKINIRFNLLKRFTTYPLFKLGLVLEQGEARDVKKRQSPLYKWKFWRNLKKIISFYVNKKLLIYKLNFNPSICCSSFFCII